jgi:hypothetical protein
MWVAALAAGHDALRCSRKEACKFILGELILLSITRKVIEVRHTQGALGTVKVVSPMIPFARIPLEAALYARSA